MLLIHSFSVPNESGNLSFSGRETDEVVSPRLSVCLICHRHNNCDSLTHSLTHSGSLKAIRSDLSKNVLELSNLRIWALDFLMKILKKISGTRQIENTMHHLENAME